VWNKLLSHIASRLDTGLAISSPLCSWPQWRVLAGRPCLKNWSRNIHNIDLPLHRSLQNLAQKYGNIFTLWLGSRRVVIISSQTLVQQCLSKHDIVLSNRARFLTGKHLFYNYSSLLSAPHGDYSRNIRRVITNDVLSTERLKSFAEMRRKETLKFITKLAKDTCEGFTCVELRTRLTNMTFEIMTRMIVGDANEMKKFKDMIDEMMPLLGNNMGDFVPLIRLFDFGGLVKRMKDVAKRGNSFMQGIIDGIRSEEHGG
ncbi:isoflavone 2'-hydroxylase-like protein, partial [Trifolium pratense]